MSGRNGRIIAIHQPHYLPWVPYFDKILRCESFVLLDNVQFQKNGMQNRNQIKTSQGIQWLTVPVRQALGTPINQTAIVDHQSVKKHLMALEFNYKKAPFFEPLFGLFEPILNQPFQWLSDLNRTLICRILDYLQYRGDIVLASQIATEGKSSDLIVELCKKLGASRYLSGKGGANYMRLEDFAAAGVDVEFQEYGHIEYPQCFPKLGFMRDLSIVDLLFNVGPESRGVIERGRVQ